MLAYNTTKSKAVYEVKVGFTSSLGLIHNEREHILPWRVAEIHLSPEGLHAGHGLEGCYLVHCS